MKKLLALLSIAALTACSNAPLSFPGVYRLSIEQGNLITQTMVDQLRPGLTKRQVSFIMGTPLIMDTFDQDRWDYIYSIQPGGEQRYQERLSIFFENNQMTHFTGDFTQTPENDQFGAQASSTSTVE